MFNVFRGWIWISIISENKSILVFPFATQYKNIYKNERTVVKVETSHSSKMPIGLLYDFFF